MFSKLEGCHQSRLDLSTAHVQVASAEITFKCPLTYGFAYLGKGSNTSYFAPALSPQGLTHLVGHSFLIPCKNTVQASKSSGCCNLGERAAGFSRISATRGRQSPESDALGGLVSRKQHQYRG